MANSRGWVAPPASSTNTAAGGLVFELYVFKTSAQGGATIYYNDYLTNDANTQHKFTAPPGIIIIPVETGGQVIDLEDFAITEAQNLITITNGGNAVQHRIYLVGTVN